MFARQQIRITEEFVLQGDEVPSWLTDSPATDGVTSGPLLALESPLVTTRCPANLEPPTPRCDHTNSERRGNNLKRFMEFHLEAKAGI